MFRSSVGRLRRNIGEIEASFNLRAEACGNLPRQAIQCFEQTQLKIIGLIDVRAPFIIGIVTFQNNLLRIITQLKVGQIRNISIS